jgi:predicted permease
MDELWLAARRLTRRPAGTLAAVVTLAVAVGAAAATWSMLSALLLRPLPVSDPDRLAVIGYVELRGRYAGSVRSGLDYRYVPHLRESGAFERVTTLWTSPLRRRVESGGGAVPTMVTFAAHDAFDVLGLRMQRGRGFTAEDDRRGAAPVAVLTDTYWRKQLGAADDAVGRTITINARAVLVVGVLAGSFRGVNLAQPADLVVPLHVAGQIGPPEFNFFAEPGHPSSPYAGALVVGRLRAGDTIEAVAARVAALPPPPGLGHGPTGLGLVSINTEAIPIAARAGMRQFGRLLAATVTLLLLVGCLAVSMLLLVRTEARREEFAICAALGAGRARLARGILIEGALLALAGALLAIPAAWWLFRGVSSFELPGGVALERLDLSLDAGVLAWAAAAAVGATLLMAAVAGAFGLRANTADAIRTRAGATPRVSRRRTRSTLVIVQVAIALVLVSGAALFTRSLLAALSLNPGLEPSRLLQGGLVPYERNVPRASALFDELAGRLRGNPAIASVSLSLSQGSMSGPMRIDGVPRQFATAVNFASVDEHYFRTLGLQVREGREFLDSDTARAPLVAIVSESFARVLGEGGSALGTRITMPYSYPPAPPPQVTVVGVVPDVVTNVAMLEPLTIYMPLAQQRPTANRDVNIRAAGDVGAARRELTATLQQIDRSVPLPALSTLQQRLGRQMNAQRFGATVLSVLGGIALLLAVVATYVLAESMATLRQRELGIRAALGATRRQLGAIVLAETARLVGAGLAAGLLLTWAGAGTIRSLLFQIAPLDVMTLATVATSILILAVLVTLRPALRSARIDVARSLRAE